MQMEEQGERQEEEEDKVDEGLLISSWVSGKDKPVFVVARVKFRMTDFEQEGKGEGKGKGKERQEEEEDKVDEGFLMGASGKDKPLSQYLLLRG